MRKEVTTTSTTFATICDQCQKNRAPTKCFLCEKDLCLDCCKYFPAGTGECDMYGSCAKCVATAKKAGQKSTRIRESMLKRNERNRTRASIKIAELWCDARDETRNPRLKKAKGGAK